MAEIVGNVRNNSIAPGGQCYGKPAQIVGMLKMMILKIVLELWKLFWNCGTKVRKNAGLSNHLNFNIHARHFFKPIPNILNY